MSVARVVLDTNVLVSAKAELIVTGDEDLLTLSHFQNIWIANPRAAVSWLQIPV